MKPAPFTYHRPRSVPEALQVLADVGADGKVLAGGQSLLPLMSMRLASPAHLVDVNEVPDLADVTVTDDAVRVGALVRHAALERHDAAAAAIPLLRQGLRHVAHATIRNRGTTVGSIAHADPSGEMPAVLTLLDGTVTAASVRGEREIGVRDLFLGALETSLEPDELVVAATFPRPAAGTGTAVLEVARRHGDYAVVGVVAAVRLDDAGAVAQARASFVTAGELGTVVDLTDAVRGVHPDAPPPDWAAAGDLADGLVDVDADIHATVEYRRQLVRVLTARALQQAAREAADAIGRDAA
ncbi:FAD binding domain-containing protein [Quadrisphaera sp. GCM10027208]|uniref:FAD binding domain-containing protein n=1 Tax=Quadrisphaera sp. GCM10027208 TaxID=3273423 RepID=UPI003605C6A1|nr:xanthine dehydrogenase family protein subunit M [Kineosporiaceae bacterium SCSIO 59966]